MQIFLPGLVRDFADALCEIDRQRRAHKQFQPGIEPFGEADAVKAALSILRERLPEQYGKAVTKRSPDLLIPDQWRIELKVLRPFGDNGKEAENWSQNLLHPYEGNVSAIADCLKLLASNGTERRAVVVFGYEHDPARIALEPCIKGFELLAREAFWIKLSDRISDRRNGLVHPVHQVLYVLAWEILGRSREIV